MKKFTLSLGLGFVASNVTATAIAFFLLNPLLNPHFKGMVRSTDDGLEMPALLGGYLLLTFLMVISYRYVSLPGNWLKSGTIYGLISGGVIFVAGHLIVAGWATIPPLPMLISGVLDTTATVACGIVIAYLYRDA